MKDRLKARLDLLAGDVWGETSHDAKKRGVRIVEHAGIKHHDRDPRVYELAGLDAEETRRGDPDNAVWPATDLQGVSHNCGIGTEPALPVVVAENNFGVSAGNAVLFAREHAAQRRLDSQDFERFAGYVLLN